MSRLRRTVYERLESENRSDRVNRAIDAFLVVIITINVIAVTLETVAGIEARYRSLFRVIEILSVAVFTVEYVLRVWVSVEDETLAGVSYPRLRYLASPMALIDLIAILPFYLGFFLKIDLRALRVLRLLRILKLTRYSAALSMLMDVLRAESHAFFAGFFILLVLLILAASGAYLVEHEAQPEAFGSIPRAMWWAVVTLTTVGYGDVTPITLAGRFFGALVAVIGIGMAALPAGILASGMAERLRRTRNEMTAALRTALEDDVIDADEEVALDNLRRKLGLSHKLVTELRLQVERDIDQHRKGHCPHCGKPLH